MYDIFVIQLWFDVERIWETTRNSPPCTRRRCGLMQNGYRKQRYPTCLNQPPCCGLMQNGYRKQRPGRQDRSISKYGSSQVYKLYDRRTGKFLRNIGKAGKNSGEYSNVYNSVIDEQNSRVYILSWNAKELLCHDLNTGDLTVAALPFEGMNEVVAWKQDKTWGGRVDSLYVVKDGFLKPIFTMNFLKGDQKTATTSISI